MMSENWNYLYLTPDTIKFGVGPDDQGEVRVAILTEFDSKNTPWLAPNIRLALSMTPAEARSIGQTLIRKAGEA